MKLKKLEEKNKKLKKLVAFWKNEAQLLSLKTALKAKAVPLAKIVAKVTSTPKGKKAWEKAWKAFASK